jgi:hypothetical protein
MQLAELYPVGVNIFSQLPAAAASLFPTSEMVATVLSVWFKGTVSPDF